MEDGFPLEGFYGEISIGQKGRKPGDRVKGGRLRVSKVGITTENEGIPEGKTSLGQVGNSVITGREKDMGEIACLEPGSISWVRNPYPPEEEEHC